MARDRRKYLGHTGDVNCPEYDGGFVYENKYGFVWEVCESWDDCENENERLLFVVGIPDNVTEYHRADWKQICTCTGEDPAQLELMAKSADVMERVAALETFRAYHGFESGMGVNGQSVTVSELNRRWRPFFKRAPYLRKA